ncbi:MAG TPA: glycosyltransferase 87 family protein [Pseudolabrys sp.]|nr:glycosyltransferase 87 family protein [Pseudolabrys sp.]
MRALGERLALGVIELFRRLPWTGWAAWIAFCVIALLRTDPRRFGATFEAYLLAAQRLAAHGQVYDPANLGDFLYLPVALLVLVPFTGLDPTLAAAITLALYALALTLAVVALTRRLFPQGTPETTALYLAGILLFVNIPAAWFNFKGVQSQIVMTAMMVAAAAAMMRAQWVWASFWLFLAIVLKPLAMVMLLLCAALYPRMRIPLILALVAALALPFAFYDWSYLIELHRAHAVKLWAIASAPPAAWPYQADFTTLLRVIGVVLPAPVSVAVRLAAALATLALAWRVRAHGDLRSSAFAILILSGCYITLFGPRNEFLSFLVVTPAIAALGFVLLAADRLDPRAWLLILCVPVLGMWWTLWIDSWMKPAIILVIYVWLGRMLLVPQRWQEIFDAGANSIKSRTVS